VQATNDNERFLLKIVLIGAIEKFGKGRDGMEGYRKIGGYVWSRSTNVGLIGAITTGCRTDSST
jgi:hypothetical protein